MLRPMRLAAPVIRATWPSSGFAGIESFSSLVEIHLNILALELRR